MKPLTREWIKKAEEDYRVAVREAKAKPGNYSAVCFHNSPKGSRKRTVISAKFFR